MLKFLLSMPVLLLSFAASLQAGTEEELAKTEEFIQYEQQAYLSEVELSLHRFGFSDPDGDNTLAIVGRIQIDTADYVNYRPDGGTMDRHLVSGINVRRARLGVVGRFGGVWLYSLEYDLGGSSDSLNINNALADGNSATLPYTSNSPLSGIINAFISYTGWYQNCTFPIAVDFGIMDVPWTLDQAINDDDSMFIERSSAQVIATEFGGGDGRSALVVRSNNDRYWIGAMLTGPRVGALHVSSTSRVPTGCRLVQLSFLGRATYQLLQTEAYSVHIGVNTSYLFHPRGDTNNSAISLSDRPELRVDPTLFLDTGDILSSSGVVVGPEAAIAIGHLFIKGEYYRYVVNQLPSTNPHPMLHFHGGYVEGSYTFGGKRYYLPILGSYTGVIIDRPSPNRPSCWNKGAIEVALRYSGVDLNSHVVERVPSARTGGIRGGKQNSFSVGLNFYPTNNIRFSLDYEMVKIEKIDDLNGITPQGASINWLALRTQVNW